MTVSKEAKYLQEFKANTKNSTFLGIIQKSNTDKLFLDFRIRPDYTWADVTLAIPVDELANADELNQKLKPLVQTWKAQRHYSHVAGGLYYYYPHIDKEDKAKLRQLLVTKFDRMITQVDDVDAILELHDNRNVRPKIQTELNGLVTMGPFQITDFITFKRDHPYNYYKGFENFDNKPFTITTNYFGQDRATSRMLVTKADGDTFTIKAGDFKTTWRHVERVEEVETTVDDVETSSMAFDL